MVNSNSVKTTAASTSNSSVNVERPIVSQAIKNEPPILTKAPQLPPPTQQQKSEPPPLQNINNNPPPVITQSIPKTTGVDSVKPTAVKTESTFPLQMPSIEKVKETTKAPILNSQVSSVETKVKTATPVSANTPVTNPFNRAPSISEANTAGVPLSGLNNSKPPTLTTPTLNMNAEKKEMPSLTPSTPVPSITSPPNGTSNKEKISFGMVDESLIAKSMTPKSGKSPTKDFVQAVNRGYLFR